MTQTLLPAVKAVFCPLQHEGVVALRGPDAARFLQGQVTCNMDWVSPQQSSLGALCTPKGRMLVSFRILFDGDGYLLAMDAPLVPVTQDYLKKYAVFFKSTLTDESTRWRRFGILAEDDGVLDFLAMPIPRQPGEVNTTRSRRLVRLAPGRLELWVPAEGASALEQELAAALQEASLNDWLLVQIREGWGQVFASSCELFIPQMINWQTLGGVSFKKGCYTGQEIVARTQHLGRMKRHLYRFAASGTTLPAPGSAVSNAEGLSVGEVVLAARVGEGLELLAVVQDSAVQEDSALTMGNDSTRKLHLLDLPYQPNPDEEIRH